MRIRQRDNLGRVISERQVAVQRSRAADAPNVAVDPRLWADAPLVVFLSGCTWRCSGGGQRPVALAREFAQAGWQVIYCNRLQAGAQWAGGPLVVSLDELERLLPELPSSGLVVCGLTEYLPMARRLQARGFDLVYDVVDNWAAFHAMGEAPLYSEQAERELMEAADIVTVSAPGLADWVRAISGREAHLVRNGGPARPFASCERPQDMLVGPAGSAVYVGYLYGQWFDWGLLERTVLALPDVGFTIVGAYTSVPQWPNCAFVGERAYPEAMRYVAHADVGLIPFRDLAVCEDVDPIKAYDYFAGCGRTVASIVMTDCAGRPGVWLQADGEDSLAPALRRALAADQMYLLQHEELVAEGSWGRRARQLAGVVKKARRQRATKSHATLRKLRERDHIEIADTQLRVTWTGTAECNMQPICPYCSTRWTRATKAAALPRSPERCLEALLGLTAERGPLYISLCYGEPMATDEMAALIGQLARYNRVDVVSNILFPLERLIAHVKPNGNLAFATSLHPHVWSVEDFIAKRRAIQAAGYTTGITEIVGYPPYLHRVAEWRQALRGAGISASVLPFYGVWQGQQYPASYSEDDWQIVLGAMRQTYGTVCEDLARRDAPAGRRCRCGADYVWIDWDGTIQRCSVPQQNGRLGNLFAGYDLLTEAAECTAAVCPCPDLWRYIEEAE